MVAPKFVPGNPARAKKHYSSPSRKRGSWTADRPGEIVGGQPRGSRLGVQGPDQGFVHTLAKRFEGKLTLEAGEHEEDALAGCAQLALKRASLFTRAPVIHDLRIALRIWGFLDDAPAELEQERKLRFAGVAHSHDPKAHYAVVDGVPAELLLGTPDQIEAAWRADWRSTVLAGQ